VIGVRAWLAAAAAALLFLLAPVAAEAHTFYLSATEAHAGDEVEYSITDTLAGESYVIKVEDKEVVSGVDTVGGGVLDKFVMPDFGDASKAVSVELVVTPTDGSATQKASQPLKFLSAFVPASAEPTPSPAPVVTVPAPAPAREPQTSTTPKSNKTKTGSSNSNKNSTKHKSGGSNDSKGTAQTTPADTTSSAPTATSTPAADSSPATSTSTEATSGPAAAPPGPTGPAAPATADAGGPSNLPALTPLSGVADVGKTGSPALVLLLIVLLAALAITAAGPRLWQRFEPRLLFDAPEDDEMRLGALQRASSRSAELQQTIATRRSARSAGRAG
jgi:hypothetical protein